MYRLPTSSQLSVGRSPSLCSSPTLSTSFPVYTSAHRTRPSFSAWTKTNVANSPMITSRFAGISSHGLTPRIPPTPTARSTSLPTSVMALVSTEGCSWDRIRTKTARRRLLSTLVSKAIDMPRGLTRKRNDADVIWLDPGQTVGEASLNCANRFLSSNTPRS